MRRTKLAEKIQNNFIGFMAICWCLYVLLSFLEVNAHSLDHGYKYSKFNLFKIITANASEELAVYEQEKGERIVHEMIEDGQIQPHVDKEHQHNLELLAHVINAEGGGATWVSDKMCYYIGSVVLNRVKSKEFPNTIEEVINQPGQYSSVGCANWEVPISERSWEVAEDLLNEGSQLPDNIVFQAEFKQGSGVYEKVQNMYFCYR